MEDNEKTVEESTENVVEQTTEQVAENVVEDTTVKKTEEKVYTESELNQKLDEILSKKISRAREKQRREDEREYSNKYSGIENILKAGLGTNDLKEIETQLKDFYSDKGVRIPDQSSTSFSERDLDLLANAEANEIISSGYDELVEEVERLANIGTDNMTAREKKIFVKLAGERKKQEEMRELAQAGITRDDLENSEYKQFASKLNPDMPAKEKYEMYLKFKPKKEIEKIGSMKSAVQENKIKEFYTPEEVRKFTSKDLDNPELMKAVENSMHKWQVQKKNSSL